MTYDPEAARQFLRLESLVRNPDRARSMKSRSLAWKHYAGRVGVLM